MSRSVVLGAAALAALLAVSTTASASLNLCASAKKKCVDKKAQGLLKCYITSEKKGLPVDPLCLDKAKAKYDGGTKGFAGSCFGKAEAKYLAGCPTTGDIQNLEDKVDAFVLDVVRELDPSYPAVVLDLCGAGKKKAVLKKFAGLLKCHEKSEKDGVTPLAPCLTTVKGKYDGGTAPAKAPFAKLEVKYPGAFPPGCQTTGDQQTLEDKVDAFVADVVCELHPADCPPHRPTRITFQGDTTAGVLDAGWTGQSHDSQVISDGLVTVHVTSCAGAVPGPYGVCNYTGPIANRDRDNGVINSQRCKLDSRVKCDDDSDCPGVGNSCEFWFGSYLPLSAGGVSTCVGNVFAGGISGTANIDTGDSTGSASLTATVYSGPTADNPCPRCVGDGPSNDGNAAGTCDSGPGTTCDANGTSPNSIFGRTSLDCPPPALAKIADLAINLDNTTGTKTKTLSGANPNCRATGFTTNKCQCDTCNDLAAEPCSSNADCPDGPDAPGAPVIGAVCGGARCQGGPFNGDACTTNLQCAFPAGACGVPGLATAPNQCDDATCNADVGNEGTCLGGPFECFCTGAASFSSCTFGPAGDAACNTLLGGSTCTNCKFRDCFLDPTVTATGVADPPVAHQSNPTLASMFCVGPTGSGAVNGVAGLPGLGRLELLGDAADNGNP